MFRKNADRVIRQLPGFEDYAGSTDKGGVRKYQLDPESFNKFSPEARAASMSLGEQVAKLTGVPDKKLKDYGIQASNIFLNQFGESIVDRAMKLLQGTKGA